MSEEREVFLDMVRGIQMEAASAWGTGRRLADHGLLTTAGSWQRVAAVKYERARVAMAVLRDSDLLAKHMDGLRSALEAVRATKEEYDKALRDGVIRLEFVDGEIRFHGEGRRDGERHA